ncbi:MAG TPA: hypothetical protein VEK08_16200 [Planctomycetota bacterium]|nr:hypothetical protein [Planctomycetota bacterium]
MSSFDDKLREEIARRDAAVERLKMAKTETQTTIKREVDDIKTGMAPAGLIQEHPWYAVFGALALGVIVGPMIKNALLPAPRYRAYAPPPPQKVVVEVVGAGRQQKPASPWKSILDAAMHGLPAAIPYIQQFMQEQGNGHADTPRAEAPAASKASSGQFGAATPTDPFKKSISRRTAPPPPES